MGAVRKWTGWAVVAALALAFASAGGAKLAGQREMVEMFAAIGIGDWFRQFTGAVEIAAGLALLIPALSSLAAMLLALTMAAAIAVHLLVIGGSPIPAAVLLAVSLFAVWLRWPASVIRARHGD